MLSRLRWLLASRCIRLGFRLLGMNPAKCVVFESASWTPQQIADWAVEAWRSTSIPAEGSQIAVPQEADGLFKAALDAPWPKPVAVAEASERPERDAVRDECPPNS